MTACELSACQFAWEIQDACNLLPVLNGFIPHLKEMRDTIGWDAAHNHAATRCWLSKVCQLAGFNEQTETEAISTVLDEIKPALV